MYAGRYECDSVDYPHGLDGTIGDLIVLPRSHRVVMENSALSELFGERELPGSMTFGSVTPLPPGSVVIVHSALLHGRRQRDGGDLAKPRFFTDVSYCQHSKEKRLWPSYQSASSLMPHHEAARGGHADVCRCVCLPSAPLC
eukprot:SAG31_NODE_4966_length_2829_cov_4.529304_3_plen_142_part_00